MSALFARLFGRLHSYKLPILILTNVVSTTFAACSNTNSQCKNFDCKTCKNKRRTFWFLNWKIKLKASEHAHCTMHILHCVVWPHGLHVHTSRYVQTCTICRSTLHVHTHTRTRTHTPTYGVGFVTLCSNPHQSAPARWAVTNLKKTWKKYEENFALFSYSDDIRLWEWNQLWDWHGWGE